MHQQGKRNQYKHTVVWFAKSWHHQLAGNSSMRKKVIGVPGKVNCQLIKPT